MNFNSQKDRGHVELYTNKYTWYDEVWHHIYPKEPHEVMFILIWW